MIFSAIFPPVCASCGLLGVELCFKCVKNLSMAPTICLACENLCPQGRPVCLSEKHHERRINISFWQYNKTFAHTIVTIKYKRQRSALLELLSCVSPQTLTNVAALAKSVTNPTLIPVPLHPEREKERGFNQATLIAQTISLMVGIPTATGVVERIKPTKQQARISSRETRMNNVRTAFLCRNKKLTETITPIIVDDVVTTGATIRAVTRSLGLTGANPTYSVCLAREAVF